MGYNSLSFKLVMYRDRQAEIKIRKQQNKKLAEQTKKMEAELEKIRRIKQIENEKLRLQKQLESLNIRQDQLEKEEQSRPRQEEPQKLRDYGSDLLKQKQVKPLKKVERFKVMEDSSGDEKEDDGQNLKYFLGMMNMLSYFQAFKANKILSLPKLRNLKEAQLKAMNVPLKDHVKLIKKIREMGF